ALSSAHAHAASARAGRADHNTNRFIGESPLSSHEGRTRPPPDGHNSDNSRRALSGQKMPGFERLAVANLPGQPVSIESARIPRRPARKIGPPPAYTPVICPSASRSPPMSCIWHAPAGADWARRVLPAGSALVGEEVGLPGVGFLRLGGA